jgi:hypothetical protein
VNSVVTEFLDALVDASADGEALEAFQGNIHADPDMASIGASTTFPLMILRRAPAATVEAARGSRFVVHQGNIYLAVYEPLTDAHSIEAAMAACDTHRANVERVLLGLRSLSTGDFPEGCWSRMTFSVVEAGGASSGPFDLVGVECYRVVYGCEFRFLRERAA